MTSRLTRRQFGQASLSGVGGAALARVVDARPWLATPEAAPARAAIRISSNENPYGPSASVLEALGRTLHERAARYPFPWAGEVRDVIAAHHGLQPENVLLGCGSTEILRVAAEAFLDPKRTLVAAEPTFEAVLDYAHIEAALPIKVPLTPDFRHDLDAMAAACTDSTDLVYVCNPNNPTGTIVSGEELRRFLKRVPAGCVALVDEAYHDFVEDPSYARTDAWLGEFPDLVVVRTFSKIHGMAGMRLGYALGSAERIAAMNAHITDTSANVVVVEGARTSLSDAKHLAEQRRLNNDTRHWLEAELAREGRRVIPSHTSFFMVQVGDAAPVIAAFADRGIEVGRRFPSLPEWLRVSIGTREEMGVFLEAFRQIVPA